MINVYKSPISKEKYANLFLDKIPEGAKNVCLLFIGHSETVHYIMSQKPEIDFTVIDGSDVTEALPYIYTADNLKERITFEESDCEDETFLKKLETCFENYIMNNMSFDLIIANPPYGKSSSLSKKIVNKMLECKVAEEMVVLTPLNTCKYNDVLEHCKDITLVKDNPFTDIVTGQLSVLLMNPGFYDHCYEDIVLTNLDPKYKTLHEAVVKYNKSNTVPSFYCIDGNVLANKWIKNLEDASKQELPETFKSIAKRNTRELFDEGYAFYNTVRSVVDGVHFTDPALDRDYNFNGIWNDSNNYQHHGDVLMFPTKVARNNFRDWWYSCTKDYKSKVECNKRGLTNALLTTLAECVSYSAGIMQYLKYFPNLDWSRPHDDAEILAEIGLPEDFLGKE